MTATNGTRRVSHSVLLPWPELRAACHAGIDRRVRALAANRDTGPGRPRNEFHQDVIGALGECVLAKALNLYWPPDLGRPDNHAADVGDYHVRAANLPTAKLLLHPEDPDDGRFVLVTIDELPRFLIAGWCYGHEGKQSRFWETFTGRPAFFVPQTELHPLPELEE